MTAILIGIAAVVVLVVVIVACRAAHWGDWWYWYHRYLDSERWEQLREDVLLRDRYTCRDCGNRIRELHIHHLRYHGWPWYALRLPEWKRDLVALCRECHRDAHGGES